MNEISRRRSPGASKQGAPTGDCPISVVILTLNEEGNLPSCLASVCGWASQVFVVDAGSVDQTRDIAAQHDAIVVEHPFETHASQWQWALASLPIATEWVLALDADQRVSDPLADELRALNASDLDGIDGLYINRQQWFQNSWIRHGGYYPKYLLKLFRRTRVVIDARDLVDHHFYVTGRTATLRHDLVESNLKEDDISFWVHKHTRYAALLAREEYLWRTSQHLVITPSMRGTPDQRALARRGYWRRMPLYLRPFLYFVYRYVVRLGFLDGKQGAVFHFMQAFWFRLLVDINLDRMEHVAEPGSKTARSDA